MDSAFAANTGFIETAAMTVWSNLPQIVLTVGVLIALAQFRHLQRSTVAENDRKRREYALTYSLTRTASHIDARQTLTEIFGATTADSEILSLKTIDDAIAADQTVLNKIRVLLNHWENMALAIYQGVADEDTAFEMVSQRVINTARQYQHYINRVHEQSPVSYKYLIWLANRWANRKSKLAAPPGLKLDGRVTRSFLGVKF